MLWIALSAGLIACGSDNPTNADAQAEGSAAAEAVDEFHRAAYAGDSAAACHQLTDSGREELVAQFAGKKSCEELFGGNTADSSGPIPKTGPVGVEDGFALVVVRFGGEYDESLVYTAREEDGEWRVDYPGPIPNPNDLVASQDATQDAEEYVNSPNGLSDADQEETDGDFDPVVAVGDVALAYQSQTLRGGAPTLLVRDGNGWHVSPISLGVP